MSPADPYDVTDAYYEPGRWRPPAPHSHVCDTRSGEAPWTHPPWGSAAAGS